MDRKFNIGDRIEIPQTADQARKLIKALRSPNGGQITELTQADGKVVSVDEASDAAVLELAQEFAHALNKAASH